MKKTLVCTALMLSAGGAIATNAAANDATPRLHPVEAACVEYATSGQMMNSTSTRCHRDYAYEQYEIQTTTISMMGITQEQNQHTITIGDTIYAINLQNNTGTKTKNPLYDGLVSALDGQSVEEMSAAFISTMGYSPTGATKTIVGQTCSVYSAQQLGTVCLTDNGLMLEQIALGVTQTATNVTIGSGGDDANYTLYQNVTITDGPDLSNGLQGIMNQMQ